MSLVESRYNEVLDRMSGRERVERTASLFGSLCSMLTLQIRRENPEISERLLRLKVAERLYLSDQNTQNLLCRVRTD